MSLFLTGAIFFYYVRSWSQEKRLWLRLVAPFLVTVGLLLSSYSSKIFAEFDYSEPSVTSKVVVSLPALCSFVVLMFSWYSLKSQFDRIMMLTYTFVTSLFLALTLWVFVAVLS